MKKRFFSMLLAVSLLLPVFCVRALAYHGVAEGDGIEWNVDEGYVLTVSGEGEMENHSPAGAGWGSWIAKNITAKTRWEIRENDIQGILVKSGITVIGNAAFAHCSNSLEAVIEEGIEVIGSHAFLENRKMTRVYIPASVKTILYMAFYNCDGLTDVYYAGTEAMWNEITVGRDNQDLLNATIHFTGEEEKIPDSPNPSRKPGDANGDGILNYKDALLILRASIGLEVLDDEILVASDVNGDDRVNYKDALKILRASINLEEL